MRSRHECNALTERRWSTSRSTACRSPCRRARCWSKRRRQIKQEIPVYCYHTKLGPAGLCRICLVEIEGMPKLQIACNTRGRPTAWSCARRATKVDAGARDGSRALARQSSAGLSDLRQGRRMRSARLRDGLRARHAPTSPIRSSPSPKAVDLGPTIVLDEERCIVCQRCVRFDDIIAGERQLVVKDRGARDIIATATGRPVPPQLHRQRHRTLPGRRADVEDVPLQIAPVGSASARRRRARSAPSAASSSPTFATARCCARCRSNDDRDLRRLALRSRPLQHRFLRVAGAHHAAALPARTARFVQIGWDDAFILWAKAIRDAIAHAARERRRDRRRPADERRGVSRCSTSSARSASHNLDWRAGRQRQATPGAQGGCARRARDAPKRSSIVGESPEERAPVMWLRVRKAALRNGAKIVAGARTPRAGARVAAGDATRVALIWDGIDLGARARATPKRSPASPSSRRTSPSEQANARGAEAMGMLPGSGPGYARRRWTRRRCDARRRAQRRARGALDLRCESRSQCARSGAPRREALDSVPFRGRQRAFHDRNGASARRWSSGERRVRERAARRSISAATCFRSMHRSKRPKACARISRCWSVSRRSARRVRCRRGRARTARSSTTSRSAEPEFALRRRALRRGASSPQRAVERRDARDSLRRRNVAARSRGLPGMRSVTPMPCG